MPLELTPKRRTLVALYNVISGGGLLLIVALVEPVNEIVTGWLDVVGIPLWIAMAAAFATMVLANALWLGLGRRTRSMSSDPW